MAITTANMGLVKWTELSDPYDHTQLSGNFQKIDEHDHTVGKGKRLSGAALESEAINTAQLKDKSVTNAKLAGGISADKLAPGTIDSLGDFKWWWRPNSSTPLPGNGWVVAAGQTLSSSNHDFPGGGNITLPNLINRFIIGVELGSVGVTGGSSTINLSHSHSVNPHQHNVPGHQHTVPPHTHFINLQSGFNYVTNLKISQDSSGSSWVHADNSSGQEHRHSINGNADSVSLTTDSTSVLTDPAGGSTDSRLSSSQSILPPHVGFLPLLKVKNS